MGRLALKPSVIKRLFAVSKNECAYPQCKEKIVDEFGTVKTKFYVGNYSLQLGRPIILISTDER